MKIRCFLILIDQLVGQISLLSYSINLKGWSIYQGRTDNHPNDEARNSLLGHGWIVLTIYVIAKIIGKGQKTWASQGPVYLTVLSTDCPSLQDISPSSPHQTQPRCSPPLSGTQTRARGVSCVGVRFQEVLSHLRSGSETSQRRLTLCLAVTLCHIHDLQHCIFVAGTVLNTHFSWNRPIFTLNPTEAMKWLLLSLTFR